ncbi:hypothetical protein QA612_20665 [Evansella sp. AB-P1]|uniref:hypothetical protein n=1 Tax=Evansella sp. AB-P1 TaxID=3037653 RepID=UPI00241C5B8E|nr:hypothetical protein [Evansella sp. AB-P1]MDG5789873.1 hypothetical protein [Evansella sp. AB-P1]
MTDERMDRFEGMLTQLVSMVGHLKEDMDTLKDEMIGMKDDMNGMKADMNGMKDDMAEVKADMAGMKATQEKQHAEMMGKLELLRMDQEITWAKSVDNERNIERLNRQLSNN